MEQQVVIIGSGAAAVECVESMQANGFRGRIDLFSDTADPPYNPMLTTYFVSGKISYNEMFPFGSGKDFWQKRGVRFHENNPIIQLDTVERKVVAKNGLSLTFDQCLIATGASPFVPKVPGYDDSKVHTVRTLTDAIRLKEAADRKPGKVVVVGASMVGIKVMELFHRAGVQVCLADLAPHIFPLAAHKECATEIESRLTAKGITLRFGATFSGISKYKDGVVVSFGEGVKKEEADLVVVCIGVHPNLDFIDKSQLAIDRGILVDERMQTSIPGIYAAGDVAQGRILPDNRKMILGLWASARCQGRTAGCNMAGRPNAYRGTIMHNITHFLGMDFVGLGNVNDYEEKDIVRGNGGELSMFFWKNGQLSGANFLDRFHESGVIKNAMMKGTVRKTSKVVNPSALLQQHLMHKLINEVNGE